MNLGSLYIKVACRAYAISGPVLRVLGPDVATSLMPRGRGLAKIRGSNLETSFTDPRQQIAVSNQDGGARWFQAAGQVPTLSQAEYLQKSYRLFENTPRGA